MLRPFGLDKGRFLDLRRNLNRNLTEHVDGSKQRCQRQTWAANTMIGK
jgi:hypothetical protein